MVQGAGPSSRTDESPGSAGLAAAPGQVGATGGAAMFEPVPQRRVQRSAPRPGGVRRGRSGYHPRVELLEARALAAVLAVTTTSDTGAGSLRAALTTANSQPGPDVIVFALPAGVQK